MWLHTSFGFIWSAGATPPKEDRRCDRHRRVLYVKRLTGETLEIPYGNWEVGLWYKCRVQDITGCPLRDMKLIFAGAQLPDDRRHSGLSIGSTLHLIS
eukprot:g33151.t1